MTIPTKIEIAENEFQTDVSLRAVHGYSYITGIIVPDWDDDEDDGLVVDDVFYRVEFRHPIDSSDWFEQGRTLSEKFKTLQFSTKEAAVESVRAELESLEFEA